MTRTAISVDHIARVEGHGNVHLSIKDGAVETCEMNVVEPARLFESMVVGRKFADVPYIASRVCGICSASHVITDILAIERIFGVQVTPRTTRGGVTARLAVRCGDDTQLYEMTAAPDGSFAADGIVFTVGSTYELSVQWTADGVTTNETLGTVDFNDEMTEPQIIWGAVGSSLDFGYFVQRVGNKQYRLTLTCYPVEVQVDAPPWMQPAQVEIDLRLNGDAGEPTATAVLDCEGESSYGNSSRTESVWNGTFYSDDVVNGWEYDGETLPKYVVRVTDTNGDVWTEEMPLSKR